MKNSLNLYHIFYTVAKMGSISGAAKALFLSQPAVSKSIARLEQGFPVPLLFRSSRGIRLTQAGQTLYRKLEVAFGEIHAGEELILRDNSKGAGSLSIGVSATLCNYVLLPQLKTYLDANPDVRISLTCQSTRETLRQLESGDLDLGLIGEAEGLRVPAFHRLGDITDTFVATPAYLARLAPDSGDKNGDRDKAAAGLSEDRLFSTATFLMLDGQNSTRQYVDKHLLLQGHTPQHMMEATTMELLISFARTGLGIACVIRQFVEKELEEGSLAEIPLREPIPSRAMGLVYSPHRITPAMERFFSQLPPSDPRSAIPGLQRPGATRLSP